MQQSEQGSYDKVEYVPYESLTNPDIAAISPQTIDLGFDSKEWFIQFQTLTNLRQANRYFANIFINELMPRYAKAIIAQVDNLRSNNSKEALTLLAETFEHQSLNELSGPVLQPLVAILFVKSVSEKGFLRSLAQKAIRFIPLKSNPCILEELCSQTQAANGVISELAIKTMQQFIEHNQKSDIDQRFLKNLSSNINGKRAVLQRTAKEILKCLKQQHGEEQIEHIISESKDLLEEESNTLRRELKREEQVKEGKNSQGLKDFIKSMKSEGK